MKTIAVGSVWRRLYEKRFPSASGWGPGLNRFSDPTGAAFGVVYLGSSAKVAFVEVILRDRADGRGDDVLLDWGESRGARWRRSRCWTNFAWST